MREFRASVKALATPRTKVTLSPHAYSSRYRDSEHEVAETVGGETIPEYNSRKSCQLMASMLDRKAMQAQATSGRQPLAIKKNYFHL